MIKIYFGAIGCWRHLGYLDSAKYSHDSIWCNHRGVSGKAVYCRYSARLLANSHICYLRDYKEQEGRIYPNGENRLVGKVKDNPKEYLGILLPLLIIGGIYSGIFTPLKLLQWA